MMQKKRILVVDDEKIILRTLSWGLGNHGYVVDTAESGGEGLAKLQHGSYNLLISDLLMDGMSGIDLLKDAREINPDMAVCLITGYADLTSAIDALRLGADDYLVKPCDMDELLLRVQSALKKEELRKKVRYFENILPVCAVCKKIRDDAGKEPGEGEWVSLEQYLRRKTGVEIRHAYCVKCARQVKDGSQVSGEEPAG
ncbi:MAG: response regulator [Proteobacteria bacterium]|nr:response regulator [Pseudomonadota bacterium]MBU4297061.1 response regulator [Pseudomonadota bacterium]MCG2749942.1 response regulator [Desulfobulbaceae bacterium]